MAPGTTSNQFLNGRAPQPNVPNQRRAIGQFQQRSGHPQRFGVNLKAAAPQFIAAHPVVAAVIPGGRNAGEVTENAAMMAAKIAGELWAAMRAEKLIPEHAPTPGNM